MPNNNDGRSARDDGVSRRDLFKRVGITGAAAALSGTAPTVATAQGAAEPATSATAQSLSATPRPAPRLEALAGC